MRRILASFGAFALALVLSLSAAGCGDDDGDPCSGATDECSTLGDTRCGITNAVQACGYVDGCLVWSNIQDCGTGFACDNAQCVCDDDCTAGDDQCAGDVVQECLVDGDGCWRWTDEEDCAANGEVCDDTQVALCVQGAGCGNGIVEGTEICDGYDFGGQSCESAGYAGGFLSCSGNCDAIDFSGCTFGICGDDTVDTGEVCDGPDLDGQTCLTQGFSGGTLACNSSCDGFDTSQCTGGGVEVCDNNVDDDSNGDTDCADTACAGHASCASGYNFDFEDWTASNPPTRYEVDTSIDATYTESTAQVNTGASSCQAHWTTTGNRDLIHQLTLSVTAGTEYTVHTWMYDNDSTGRARPAIAWSTGANDYAPLYSTDLTAWQEVVLTAVAPTGATGLVPFIRLYDTTGFDPAVGATIYTDDWAVTEHHPYTAGPTLDTDTLEAANDGGAGFVNIGVNDEGVMYLATQAGVNATSDRAVFLWAGAVDTTSTVPAPWSKAGTLMAPDATGYLLAFMDEGDSSFCGWWAWDPTVPDWVEITSGVDCYDSFSDTTNLLSGWLDAATELSLSPAELPALAWVASVEYGTANGGAVLSQMPAAVTADDNITGDETVSLHRVEVLSGKIHP